MHMPPRPSRAPAFSLPAADDPHAAAYDLARQVGSWITSATLMPCQRFDLRTLQLALVELAERIEDAKPQVEPETKKWGWFW